MKKSGILLTLCLFGISAVAQDYSSYQPMPVPQWQSPWNPTGKAAQIISCNAESGQVQTFDIPDADENQQSAFSPAYNPGVPESPESFPGMKTFTDLSLISDPTPYPWCTNVKLFMTFPNNSHFVGSGTMIASKYVITAGHCVYSNDNGGWATEITVAPAYHGGIYPYGVALAANLYSWTSWTVNHDYDYDMGYIELLTDMGPSTGWLGYAYQNDNNFFTGNTFHNPGYPAESPYDGSQMYYWYGNYDNVQTNLLYYTKICYGGQSGSGSYYKDGSDNRYVYAVLSHQLGSETGHVRITSDKFTSMYNRITDVPSISEIGEELFIPYPNPCNGNFRIRSIAKNGEISIFNILGKLVYSGKLQSDMNIDLSECPSGIYFLYGNDSEKAYHASVRIIR